MRDENAMGDMLTMTEHRFFGKYRGTVHNNSDPTGRGRLQVLVPAVMGEEPVWAMPCVPYAGQNVGLFALPENGTGVWVEFEAGDPSYPIWVGCFWADGEIAAGELLIENQAGSVFKLTSVEISQKSTAVTQKAGAKKTTLTPAHFDVHNGAFTVV